ncbi:hypothetical protein, partial [Klebsiella pneumoniae]|uniref:hypothetical protein n=1 Tax=Klebsiella pneumoniae TaxID=573 RepID=UPI001C8F8877
FVPIEDLPAEKTTAPAELVEKFEKRNEQQQGAGAQRMNDRMGRRQRFERNRTETEHNESAAQYDFADILRVEGVLETMPDNYGFLRSSDYNY